MAGACSSCSDLATEALIALRLGRATMAFAISEIDGLTRLVARMGDDELRTALVAYAADMPARLRVVLAPPPSAVRH
jgi:hypothetical protein